MSPYDRISTLASGFQSPEIVSFDATARVLYVPDTYNYQVKLVAVDTGGVTLFAGSQAQTLAGDGGPATSAALNLPTCAVLASSGDLFICDYSNARVRRVVHAGTITTFAGSGSTTGGFSGDGGQATSARLSGPGSVAIDPSGVVYIADSNNGRIRAVARNGTISTFAGTGVHNNAGDGGPASLAQLTPCGMAFDGAGNLYISSMERVRLIAAVTTTISTFAGSGPYGGASFGGDGGLATAALFSFIAGIAFDGAWNLFLCDANNHRVRRVDATSLVVTTVAGNGLSNPGGDGLSATDASIRPFGIAIDVTGSLFVTDARDSGNSTIRVVYGAGVPLSPSPTPTPTSTPASLTQAPSPRATSTSSAIVPNPSGAANHRRRRPPARSSPRLRVAVV